MNESVTASPDPASRVVLVVDDPDVGPGARTTLWTVRLLGRAGYLPFVLTPDAGSMAAASRHAFGRATLSRGADDGGIRRAVEELAARLDPLEVLPCGDRGVLALHPSSRSLIDKLSLMERVEEAGMTSPPTIVLRDAHDVAGALDRVPLPAVVKPNRAHGATVVHDREELLAATRDRFPLLIQPFLDAPIRSVAGVRVGGRFLAIVHQRFDRIWPPAAGMASASTTTAPDPDLERRIGVLLGGYEGVFQVQLLGPHVMDVNLRVYASLSLAAAAGLNLPAILCDARRGLEGPLRYAREGVRYRWLDGDVRSVAVQVRGDAMSLRDGVSALLPRPGTARGGPESIRDPKPLLARIRAGRPERADGAALRVLLVGQGPPARGGIPTFIETVRSDPALAGDVRFAFRNTTRDPARPGGATFDNIRWTVADAVGVFRAARRADVVHLHLAPAPLLPLVRAGTLVAAARLAGARTLLHAHSGRLHVAARSAVYRGVLRVIARGVDRIVAVSADGARTFRAAGGRVEVLPNAIDTRGFPDPIRDPARVRVAFVGTVCERKGLEDLRLALIALRDGGRLPDGLDVTIVGDGRQEGPGVFERVRESYRTSALDMVAFVGARPPEEVAAILAATDVFVLPSHWEGLPLSLLEAMAAGAAPVATCVGDVPEVLDQGRSGVLVAPHRPDELAAALGRLIADPDERATLGEAARTRVRERYDRRAMTARLGELYRELAYSR